ncbi:MAG: hypothetical protein ACRC45_00580 [Cetobacterium sp.]
MKECVKCNEVLDISNFYRMPSKKDATDRMCKKCRLKVNKESRDRNAHKKTDADRKKAYETLVEWRNNNREKVREYSRNQMREKREELRNGRV